MEKFGVDSDEVTSGRADPGTGREVSSLACAGVVPSWLLMAKAQPGRGRHIGRGHVVIDEAVEDAVLGLGATEGSTR